MKRIKTYLKHHFSVQKYIYLAWIIATVVVLMLVKSTLTPHSDYGLYLLVCAGYITFIPGLITFLFFRNEDISLFMYLDKKSMIPLVYLYFIPLLVSVGVLTLYAMWVGLNPFESNMNYFELMIQFLILASPLGLFIVLEELIRKANTKKDILLFLTASFIVYLLILFISGILYNNAIDYKIHNIIMRVSSVIFFFLIPFGTSLFTFRRIEG